MTSYDSVMHTGAVFIWYQIWASIRTMLIASQKWSSMIGCRCHLTNRVKLKAI